MADDTNPVEAVDPLAAKPFDVKVLEERLVGQGLAQVEGLARIVVETVFAWAEDSIKASPSKYDDLALGLLGPFRSYVLAKIDQIASK